MLQQHHVKLETKPKKFEDRVLVRALDWGSLGGEGKEPRDRGNRDGERCGDVARE